LLISKQNPIRANAATKIRHFSDRLLAEQWPKLSETLRVMITRARADPRAKAPADGFKPIDIETLRREIAYAAYRYEAGPWAVPTFGAYTLHKAAKPVGAVLAALCNPANEVAVFEALGDGNFAKGSRRRDALVGYLTRLGLGAARPRPGKRPNHRPEKNVELRLLGGRLGGAWLRASGLPFTNKWHGKEPVSAGAQFLHAVVQVVDPLSLPQLPGAARLVVSKRKGGKVPGYFGDVGRKDAI
jgi:hypothetical protein